MIKNLLLIEWLKLKSYRPFWWLIILYLVVAFGLSMLASNLLNWWDGTSQVMGEMAPDGRLFFQYPNLWAALAWFGRYLLPIFAFPVVNSVYNEFKFQTLRQNIIDGLSKWQWLLSKILLITALALLAGLVHTTAGLFIGLNYNTNFALGHVFGNFHFIGAFVLQVWAFLALAIIITLLTKKSILSYGILLLSYFPLEYLLRSALPAFTADLHSFFPMKAIVDIIAFPFKMSMNIDSAAVAFDKFLIVLVQCVFYVWLSWFILKKKDL